MKNDTWLYPRLPMAVARSRAHEIIRTSTYTNLSSQASAKHEQCFYAPTGGRRISETELETQRSRIVTRWKDEKSLQSGSTKFDWIMAECVFAELQMDPGEAAQTEVWSFLTCVLLPDISRYRFPDTTDWERFVGGERNTLQRLWWRAYYFQDPEFGRAKETDPWWILRDAGENDLVGVMERPNLRANKRLTFVIGKAMAKLRRRDAEKKKNKKTTTIDTEKKIERRLKKITQLLPVVSIDSLDQSEIEAFVTSVFQDA